MNLHELYESLIIRLKKHSNNGAIKNQFVKIKLSNFKSITIEKSSQSINLTLYESLLSELVKRSYGKIRLLGLGAHLHPPCVFK